MPAAATPKPLVMHVVEAFGGGVFESIRQLAAGTETTHRTLIVHSVRPQTPQGFHKQFPASTQFVHLPMVRAIHPLEDVKHLLALRRLIKQHRPAYVHAHSSKAGALVRLAVLGTGVPSGYSPRGYAFLMLDQHPAKRFMYSTIEKLLGLLPTTTIACGYDEGKIAAQTSRHSVVIPNSLPLGVFPQSVQKRPPVEDELIVIGSGRISPQKNFPLFLEIARHFTGKPIRFIWVGGSEDALPELPANLTVTGWLPQQQAHAVLHTGHVYLHLSGWEGLSRAVLESMACGFPLILSDVVGNRELVAAENGYICTSRQEAVNALETFLKKPALIHSMGQKSLAHLTRHYNWDNALKSWKTLYNGKNEGPRP